MTQGQPKKGIKECQLEFVTGAPVHEQSANVKIPARSSEVWAIFTESNVTPNMTITYTMLKCSL
jgi:hypothetical protein